MFDGLDIGVQVLLIAPGDLVRWADHVRPHVGKMADGSGGRYLASDIFAALAAGRMQLWVTIDGAEVLCVVVSEIENYPRLRALRLIGLVGHQPRRWRALIADIERAAKERMGCTMMEAFHIHRFAALLPGYRQTHCFSEKVIG